MSSGANPEKMSGKSRLKKNRFVRLLREVRRALDDFSPVVSDLSRGSFIHPLHPLDIFQIPIDRRSEPRFEVHDRALVSEFFFRFRVVDRITKVVPRSVGDEFDLGFVFFSVRARTFFIENAAKGFCELDVFNFLVSAEVIGFTDLVRRNMKEAKGPPLRFRLFRRPGVYRPGVPGK